jgi:MarR family transcriptional regulator, organic hydroperoxide resistance regulator
VPLGPALEFLRTLWAVDQGLGQMSARMERDLGVTGPQRLALRIIARRPGIGPAELAVMLHVHRSASTGIIRRLEAKQLVAREAHPLDARRWVLKLTAAGRRADLADRGTIEARVRQVLEDSDGREVEAVTRVLERLSGALRVLD